MSKILEKYISACSITFKAFDHEVVMNKSKTTIWHFTSFSERQNKKYMVYCVPDMKKARSLIKIAIRKVPSDARLVVVCSQFTQSDQQDAMEKNYCLISIDVLRKYGAEMLVICSKKAA